MIRTLAWILVAAHALGARDLRVCADPNNLPFSNERAEGFENRIAQAVGNELGARVEFVWWAQRKQLVRQTLDEGRCDALAGVPVNMQGGALATAPYYRSSYAFVYRRGASYAPRSLGDPVLKRLRIGIHVVGNDYAPPAFVLAKHGVVNNIMPYSLYGAYGEDNPPARLIAAVARGDIDVAISWGPLASYFARLQDVPLEVEPVGDDAQAGAIPLAYDIGFAVAKGNAPLRDEIDRALTARRDEIHRILADYGISQVK